jgi:FdhE protein
VTSDATGVRRRLDARAARAVRLAGERPSCAEVLRFYAHVAAAQRGLIDHAGRVLPPARGSAAFGAALDAEAVAALLPDVVADLRRVAPAGVAARLAALGEIDRGTWISICAARWVEPVGDAGDVSAVAAEIALQPFAEVWAAARTTAVAAGPGPDATRCPTCTTPALVSRFDERGHGAARALTCGFCATRWDVPRAVCPHCGETRVEALPVFRDGDGPAVRIDACDSCRVYVKAVDLTVDGHAEPVVDDLATLPLDLWAADQGYRRLRPNLLRV